MFKTLLHLSSAAFLAATSLPCRAHDIAPPSVAEYSLPAEKRAAEFTKPDLSVLSLGGIGRILTVGGPWSPEAEVLPPDAYVDGGHSLATDVNGVPWLVWYRKIKGGPQEEVAYWSKWDGDHWRTPALVDSAYSGLVHKPRITFDASNVAWVVWNEHEGSDIWFTREHDGTWDKSQRVHAPDAYEYYSPEISCGGGETWLTWYGNDGHNEYDIFVTRWSGSDWDAPQNLTADVPGFHWFCDIAVDKTGVPHLIWGNSQTGELLYTFKPFGKTWQTFETINQGPVVPDGWPMSDIRVDAIGYVHVAWVGRAWEGPGTLGDADLYYSVRKNDHWSEARQVNKADSDWTYYPELAVKDSDHVWFTWGDEGSSWTEKAAIYAAYFDGQNFSEETHLDTGSFWWNQVPRIQLNADLRPWVVWGAIQGDFSESSLLYSVHLDNPVPVLFSGFSGLSEGNRVRLNWWADGSAFSRFDIERAQAGTFDLVGTLESSHEGIYEWAESGLAEGFYTYRVRGTQRDGAIQYLGPIQISVASVPKQLLLRTPGLAQVSVPVRVGLPAEEMVTISVYDVVGRLVYARPPELMQEGWHDLQISGLPEVSGLYVLKVSSGKQSAFAKITMVR